MGRAGLTGTVARGLVFAGAAGAVAATAHTSVNLRLVRVPSVHPPATPEAVSLLLPVRNEAQRVGPCLSALLRQRGVPDLEILILDDGSTDDTEAVVRSVAGTDPRVRVIAGRGLPLGWLGKPHACAQLAESARGSVLVFVDADVVLEPHAVAATVDLLRSSPLDLVCPYPRQVSGTLGERLVQPLLQWSWMTFLPLGVAETSPRPSLVAANGQLLVCDAPAYAAAGGHAGVRAAVLEDVELAKAFKTHGLRAVVADGTDVATCRMYGSWEELQAGYAKSLWTAFGSSAGAVAVSAVLSLMYVVPPVAAIAGTGSARRAGLVGTAAGVLGRALVARRVGGRVWPDSAAHPVSVGAFVGLTLRSLVQHRRGALTWKGRPL